MQVTIVSLGLIAGPRSMSVESDNAIVSRGFPHSNAMAPWDRACVFELSYDIDKAFQDSKRYDTRDVTRFVTTNVTICRDTYGMD